MKSLAIIWAVTLLTGLGVMLYADSALSARVNYDKAMQQLQETATAEDLQGVHEPLQVTEGESHHQDTYNPQETADGWSLQKAE